MPFATFYLIDTWITNNLFRASGSGSTGKTPKCLRLSKVFAKFSESVDQSLIQLQFPDSVHSSL